MRVTIDGIPATIDVPEGHHLVDVILVARAVANDDVRHDRVIVGSTDHTGHLVCDMLLEQAEYAVHMVDEDAHDD